MNAPSPSSSPREFFTWVEEQLHDGNAGVETACRAGCSWCCRGNVPPVSRAEQTLLLEGLAGLSEEVLEAAKQKAREIAAAGLDDGPQMTTGNRACPLLDEATDQCRVYQFRPLACRLFGATTIEPGWYFGCDAIQLGLALSGRELVRIGEIVVPFEQRPDVAERVTLARFLAGV